MHVASHHALIVIVFDSIHKGIVWLQNSSFIYKNCSLNLIFLLEIISKYLGPTNSIYTFERFNLNQVGWHRLAVAMFLIFIASCSKMSGKHVCKYICQENMMSN